MNVVYHPHAIADTIREVFHTRTELGVLLARLKPACLTKFTNGSFFQAEPSRTLLNEMDSGLLSNIAYGANS